MTACEFCRATATRALWGHPTCDRCAHKYFDLGESMLVADAEPLRCACGRHASYIVDGTGLCGGCYPSIARALDDALERQCWARTMVDITGLPEAS
jgi:hypothetical protein